MATQFVRDPTGGVRTMERRGTHPGSRWTDDGRYRTRARLQGVRDFSPQSAWIDRGPSTSLSLIRLRCVWKQTLLDQGRRAAVMRRPLPSIGVSEKVPVPPGPRGELQTERQASAVVAAHHDYRRYADHVHPAGRRVRTIAQSTILRHRLIGRRHLNGGIYVAIEMEPLQGLQIGSQRAAARVMVVGLGVGILFDVDLRDRDVADLRIGRFFPDDRGSQRSTHRFLVLSHSTILRGSKDIEESFRALAHVGIGTDTACNPGETIRKDGVVEDDRGAGGPQFIDGSHEDSESLGTQRNRLVGRLFRSDVLRYRGRESMKRDACAREDERRDAEAFAFELTGPQISGVWAGLRTCGGIQGARVERILACHD